MGKVYSKAEIAQFVRPLIEKYGMASASLFGSYARGDATHDSDIDILLVGKPGFRPLNVFGFGEELRRALGKDVDVYEISELDEGPFRREVLAQAVAL